MYVYFGVRVSLPHSGTQFPGSDLLLGIHVVGDGPMLGQPQEGEVPAPTARQPLALIQRFVVLSAAPIFSFTFPFLEARET